MKKILIIIVICVASIITSLGFCVGTEKMDNFISVDDSPVFSAERGNYVVLNNSITFKEQIQGMSNTVFEVRNCFDLGKSTVEIPSGCILLFRGGALKNGVVIFNNTLIDSPNYQIFGDNCDLRGVLSNSIFYADWFNDLQDAVEVASVKGGIIQLSTRVYELNKTLVLKKGITLQGSGNEAAYLENKGTTITYKGKGPVVALSGTLSKPVKNVTLRNLRIRGNGKNYEPGTNVGLYIGPRAYYCKFEDVSLYACSNGVEIDNGWNLNFESVNPYYCKNGYFLNGKSGAPLTTTVFSSCVAYNSTVGFNFSSDMNSTTLMSCGTDGCETSMELAGCFGVSVVSYQFERYSKYGIHIDNSDCFVTFVGLAPRALGASDATLIKIDRVGRVTFTNMYLSNSVVPKEGLTIDVSSNSTAKVLFDNCVLKGKGKNLDKCVFINDIEK